MDAVHNETYRVLGTLTEVGDEDLSHANNKNKRKNKRLITVSPRDEWEKKYCEQRSIFDDELVFDLTKYVKKHQKICKTLSKKHGTKIRYKESDLLQRTDPLFHKMSTLFDTQGAKGLLLNHLKCSTDRPYLLLDANEKVTKCLHRKSSQICIHERQSQVCNMRPNLYCF